MHLLVVPAGSVDAQDALQNSLRGSLPLHLIGVGASARLRASCAFVHNLLEGRAGGGCPPFREAVEDRPRALCVLLREDVDREPEPGTRGASPVARRHGPSRLGRIAHGIENVGHEVPGNEEVQSLSGWVQEFPQLLPEAAAVEPLGLRVEDRSGESLRSDEPPDESDVPATRPVDHKLGVPDSDGPPTRGL